MKKWKMKKGKNDGMTAGRERNSKESKLALK
jgi:hypothetical protein